MTADPMAATMVANLADVTVELRGNEKAVTMDETMDAQMAE